MYYVEFIKEISVYTNIHRLVGWSGFGAGKILCVWFIGVQVWQHFPIEYGSSIQRDCQRIFAAVIHNVIQ